MSSLLKSSLLNNLSTRRINRVRWILISVAVIITTFIEVLEYRTGEIPVSQIILDWVVTVGSVIGLFYLGFAGIERIQKRLEAELAKSQQNSLRQSALVQLSADLAASLDESEICEKIVTGLHHNLGYQYLRVYLKNEDTITSVAAARVGGGEIPTQPYNQAIKSSSPPYINGQFHYIHDLSKVTQDSGPQSSGSEVNVPLKVGNQVLGVLVVRDAQVNAFSDDDFMILTTIANQASIAINNARLISGEQRHLRELNALHQATATLLTTLDLDLLLAHVLKGAIGSIPAAQTGSIYLANHRDDQLELKTIQGFHDPRVEQIFEVEKGYALTTWSQKKPLLIPDIRADHLYHYDDNIPEIRAIRSAISVPLISADGAIGVLSLDSYNINAFTEDDLQLLETFAKTATTAIINAQTHQETERLAITDSLTDLYNRRHLFELARREFVRARRYNRPLSLLMIDLDHFKLINDTCGHATGDQVLHVIADRCREAIRELDTLGRYGGEEFCAILPEATIIEAAEVADRIRKRVAEKVVLTEQGTFSITISVGVAEITEDTTDFLDLMHQADMALYKAKQSGRNRVSITK